MTAIFSIKAIREIERATIHRLGVPGFTLMARAGQAAFNCLQTKFSGVKTIAVVCGGGNNGGDGYVLAQLAHEKGLSVTVLSVGDTKQLKGDAKMAFDACRGAGVTIQPWQAALGSLDLIVDAFLGIGMQGDLQAEAVSVINVINAANAHVLALDVPSGVNADTGYVSKVAVNADVTMTFIGMKRGLFTGGALNHVGNVMCDNLQVPKEAYQDMAADITEISSNVLLTQLQHRSRNAHKTDFGHVLVIAGNQGFSGAARMAAEAALSVGAGLVTVATHPAHANVVNVGRPELMVTGVVSSKDLAPLIKRATVIIVGPGLGCDTWGHDLLHAATATDLPMVVDADGLNILAEKSQHQSQWILTPHEGEAARLLGSEVQGVSRHRFDAITKIQHRYGGVCVLKGAGTLVADGKNMRICTAGNPGMATAGMGDVLSGVIGGLLAQHANLLTAASLGVALHAQAGDLASEYGQRGLMATDLYPYLRQLVNA